jgi:hypothetical protein
MLSVHLGQTTRASPAATRVAPPARELLLRAGLPRPPPPARGRCGEFDGGLFFIDGGGEGSSLVCVVMQFGSWNEF